MHPNDAAYTAIDYGQTRQGQERVARKNWVLGRSEEALAFNDLKRVQLLGKHGIDKRAHVVVEANAVVAIVILEFAEKSHERVAVLDEYRSHVSPQGTGMTKTWWQECMDFVWELLDDTPAFVAFGRDRCEIEASDVAPVIVIGIVLVCVRVPLIFEMPTAPTGKRDRHRFRPFTTIERGVYRFNNTGTCECDAIEILEAAAGDTAKAHAPPLSPIHFVFL